MEFKTKAVYCKMCDWGMQFPATTDYSAQADDALSRHITAIHGYISVLQHEYELHNAVETAARKGREEGRKMIREEMKNAVIEAAREIGRSL